MFLQCKVLISIINIKKILIYFIDVIHKGYY
nr:MAG TPA: hypothetical protein [Caudoviricetes sp.]